jgi:DNA-binding response OmpR family regulator
MSKAQILLVEDDAIIRDLVQRNLSVRGHTVHVAADASSALVQLRSAVFDLIVLDINLPDETGWDLIRAALREGCIQSVNIEGEGQKLPIIVLSAVRVSPHRLAEFHPIAYLPKPFPMDALLRLATEAAERRAGEQQNHEMNSVAKRQENLAATPSPGPRLSTHEEEDYA